MKEQLEPGLGYAVIERRVFSSRNGRQHELKADTYTLAPGEGLLFYFGVGDNPRVPLPFQQSELGNILNDTDVRTIQFVALVEQQSGGLLLADLRIKKRWGIGGHMPESKRALEVDYGGIVYVGIWGESPEEVNARLKVLQQQRIRRK